MTASTFYLGKNPILALSLRFFGERILLGVLGSAQGGSETTN